MEKPILFSGDMVRAILDGRKTQTRRVIKPQPERVGGGWMYAGQYFADDGQMKNYLFHDVYGNGKCPYGGVYADGTAEWLWVRETFQWCSICGTTNFRANSDGMCWLCSEDLGKWQPSIFMPREASRLTLRVVGVRVERVRDISEAEAQREGWFYQNHDLSKRYDPVTMDTARKWFAALWDSINAKRGYSWDSNPWVWVVEFKAVTL